MDDDRDLLARHAAGDPDAFGEVVRRHRDRLWAVALRTLGDPEEAADAVQDALISAFRAARSGTAGYRGEAAVTTWLHRIVVNACLDRLRRRAARATEPLPDTDVPDPVDRYADRDLALAVSAALRTLPPEQRAALVLVDLQGFSVDDAARVLDVAPGTVKSRCSRGRARLAPLLADLRPRPEGTRGGGTGYGGGNHDPDGGVPPAPPPHRPGQGRPGGGEPDRPTEEVSP